MIKLQKGNDKIFETFIFIHHKLEIEMIERISNLEMIIFEKFKDDKYSGISLWKSTDKNIRYEFSRFLLI
jgi:hypothetical protein